MTGADSGSGPKVIPQEARPDFNFENIDRLMNNTCTRTQARGKIVFSVHGCWPLGALGPPLDEMSPLPVRTAGKTRRAELPSRRSHLSISRTAGANLVSRTREINGIRAAPPLPEPHRGQRA